MIVVSVNLEEHTMVLYQLFYTNGFIATLGSVVPNQKNIYGAALALIAFMNGIMQGIIAVASYLPTMALYGNGRDPQ